jgi:hypothetical protein
MTEPPEKSEKLIFIFDSDSFPENKISLFLKRSLTPSKIDCPLYRLTHNAKGLKPEAIEYVKKFGLPYEILYRNEFIKKYEGFEIFGKFKISDAVYPSIFIVVGDEREERDIYELVAARYFNRCESLTCFGRVLERKYAQFKELGHAEFKRVNDPAFKASVREVDEKEEKKQKIENAHQKIVDMENEIKKNKT